MSDVFWTIVTALMNIRFAVYLPGVEFVFRPFWWRFRGAVSDYRDDWGVPRWVSGTAGPFTVILGSITSYPVVWEEGLEEDPLDEDFIDGEFHPR